MKTCRSALSIALTVALLAAAAGEGHEVCRALTHQERVALWQTLVAARDRAISESTLAFPDSAEQRLQYRQALESSYFEQAAGRHGFSLQQQYDLLLEGYLRDWPVPVRDDDHGSGD